jgi:hypothetical protein
MQPIPFKKQNYGKNSTMTRILLTGLLSLSVIVAFLVPVGAYFWRSQPFTGFLLEPTLVITDIDTSTIQAVRAGILPAMHILRIAGSEIDSIHTYNQVLRGLSIGELVSVTTLSRDGIIRVHPGLRISRFPTVEFLKLFWLPYIIGLVYLICGIWIYRIKERTSASNALGYFFFTVSIICMLLFDLYTTHSGSTLWILAMAALGSTMLLMVFDFPQELRWVNKTPYLRYLSFMISALLAIWGVWAIHISSDPWSYFENWFAIFRYIGVGILLLVAKIFWIAFRGYDPKHRTQARIILIGTFFGFLPMNYFFLAPVLGIQVQFDPLFLFPSLVIFPLSIIFAISRYRLLSNENVVNQAVTFGVITTIVAGFFPALIKFFQDIFFSITGQKNETAVFVTTFVLVALVEPIKKGVQDFVSGKSREKALDDLSAFQKKGFPVNAVFDADRTCRDLLIRSAVALNVENAAIAIEEDHLPRRIISIGRWPAEVGYYIPIVSHNKHHLGHLYLGKSVGKEQLTQQKLDLISELVQSLGDILFLNSKIQMN